MRRTILSAILLVTVLSGPVLAGPFPRDSVSVTVPTGWTLKPRTMELCSFGDEENGWESISQYGCSLGQIMIAISQSGRSLADDLTALKQALTEDAVIGTTIVAADGTPTGFHYELKDSRHLQGRLFLVEKGSHRFGIGFLTKPKVLSDSQVRSIVNSLKVPETI